MQRGPDTMKHMFIDGGASYSLIATPLCQDTAVLIGTPDYTIF